MKTDFPVGFYWGAATASYQVEGGIDNCDWAEAARAGRVPVCGRACDHYNRYEADFDLAVELGHTAHRFSIEWARIEPEEGKFDMEEVEHYRKVIQALKDRNLEPMVTLWHFTLPLWFSQSGGFVRSDAYEVFGRYVEFVSKELGAEVTHITTMNEPNVYATQGYINGEWAPFVVSTKPWQRSYGGQTISKRAKLLGFVDYLKVMKQLVKSHNHAYTLIKKNAPHAQVSFVKHVHVYLVPKGLLNYIRAKLSDHFQNHRFTKKTINHVDEIGINYYQASQFGVEVTPRKTDMGWYFAPEYIYEALMLMSKYNKPLFVSECGIADHDDSDRAEYIIKQVEGVRRAIADGADVRGHLYWSLMDNYEWALGFEKQFGLIKINYDTMEREIRPSAWVYKDLITKYSRVE